MEMDDITKILILILVSFVVMTILGVCSAIFLHIGTPEIGEHTGYVTEIGYSGLIWKTHYVKLVSSHFSAKEGGSEWDYGFDESDLKFFNQMKELNKDQLIRISYECEWIVPKWKRSDSCKITNVEVINCGNMKDCKVMD